MYAYITGTINDWVTLQFIIKPSLVSKSFVHDIVLVIAVNRPDSCQPCLRTSVCRATKANARSNQPACRGLSVDNQRSKLTAAMAANAA